MANNNPKYLTFKADGGASYVKLNAVGITSEFVRLQYKKSTEEDWTDYTFDSTSGEGTQIDLSDGEYVSMCAADTNNTFSISRTKYYQFAFNHSGGYIQASGNINTILSHDGSNVQLPDYAFYSLFKDCKKLTTAPELPATNLGTACYYGMFWGCGSLKTSPKLPATQMAWMCYNMMFYGSGITKTPDLPAENLAQECYQLMFYNCYSLVDVMSQLPAKKLATSCYYGMFYQCDKITKSPTLPSRQLGNSCYKAMFYGCSNLDTIPAILPATTLTPSCYEGMFQGCKKVVSAPQLPATSLAKNCYKNMFNGCSNLKNIVVQYTDWKDASNNECTTDWVNGVSSSGNFSAPSALPKEYGSSRIPTGWTVEEI